MILVSRFDLKFLLEIAATAVGTSNRRQTAFAAKAMVQPYLGCPYRAAIGFWPFRRLSVVHAIASDLRKTQVVARLAAMRSAFRQ
jgi:hypothetical protein